MPVPSPDQGGGFLGKVSNLPRVKQFIAQSTGDAASEQGQNTRNTTRARNRNKLYRKKQQVRIACWNIKTLFSKDHEIIPEMNEHKIDICALSETKKKGRGLSKLNNYILVYSGVEKDQRATSGVGLLVHEKYEENIVNVEYVSDRILKVTMSFDRPLHILSVYAPDISKPEEAAVDFYESLQSQLDKIPATEKIIILGDLNARVGNEVVNGVKQKYNEDVINRNGEMLTEFCAQNELRINNTFFPHKEQHKYTFYDNRNNKSIIDYIITNRMFLPQQILDVRVLSSANIGTDHKLVLGKLKMITPLKKKTPSVKTEKFNVESLNNESTKQLYSNRCKQYITLNPILQQDNPDIAWLKLKENIYKGATEALGTRTVSQNGKPNNKPWFTTEVKNITTEKKQIYLEYKNHPTPENRNRYIEIRNRVNNRVREIKEEYWQRFSAEMEADIYGAQKRIWKLLRGMKKDTNETIQLKTITNETWEKYFKNLYTELEYEEEEPTEEDLENDIINEPVTITKEQVAMAISKLKNRKAPNEDKITNEMIKYSGEAMREEYTKLFNIIIQHGKIPEEWKRSVTVPIFKKGDKTNPANYRGITLLSTSLKLLTKILADDITSIMPISEEQQGFRKNRSTVDALFITRQLVEKSLEYNTPAYLCFIDLTKAFDRVQLKDVIKILENKEVPKKYIRLIKDLNTNTTTQIRTNHTLTQHFGTTSGIRQGDSLSPLLFNTVMDQLVETVKNLGLGYRMGTYKINILCYADDAVLIAESEDDLQRMLHAFSKRAKNFNMEISISKTKCMTIAKEPLRCKLTIDNTTIDQIMSFEYLGCKITSTGYLEDEVRRQVNKAATVSGHLKQPIWRNKHLSIPCKSRIYKTCVRPIMTYGAETRAETSVTKRILRTTEMKTLRTITGYTLNDRQRNTDIREKCETDDIVRWVRKRRREWNQHVNRMTTDRIAKIARNNIPHGRRPIGRPPKRWRDSWQSTSQELLQNRN